MLRLMRLLGPLKWLRFEGSQFSIYVWFSLHPPGRHASIYQRFIGLRGSWFKLEVPGNSFAFPIGNEVNLSHPVRSAPMIVFCGVRPSDLQPLRNQVDDPVEKSPKTGELVPSLLDAYLGLP